MAYKYEDMVVKEMEDLGCDLEQTNYFDVSKELQEVYKKAKAFDEVTKFITERLNEEKTTDEYDYGERFMCEEIKRLLEDEVDEDWYKRL